METNKCLLMSLRCVYFSDEGGCGTAYEHSVVVTAAEMLCRLSREANELVA